MTTEKESGEETVYEESGGEKAPYVSKEILPEIEGVLVVAEMGSHEQLMEHHGIYCRIYDIQMNTQLDADSV